MGDRRHGVCQHKTAIAGIEAMTIASNHAFPRHSHDDFGIGLITFGAQRSWSGIGQVEAVAGDAIMVNPGEIHDGLPLDHAVRGWRMLYVDPALLRSQLAEEVGDGTEITRPVARDPVLAMLFLRAFARITVSPPDDLAAEEDLLRALIYVLQRHGVRAPRTAGPVPAVEKALRRLDMAPEKTVSLTELATLSDVSRFQLLRGFARDVGMTPHAYLVQRRVRLARRLLAGGLSPSEAAVEAGFSDQSHMTRAFVRQFGTTPARYKNTLTQT